MAAADGPSCGGRLDTGEPRLPLCTLERSWNRNKRAQMIQTMVITIHIDALDCAPHNIITHAFQIGSKDKGK